MMMMIIVSVIATFSFNSPSLSPPGFRALLSPGHVFLLTVMLQSSQTFSTRAPSNPLGRRSNSTRWLSVPPGIQTSTSYDLQLYVPDQETLKNFLSACPDSLHPTSVFIETPYQLGELNGNGGNDFLTSKLVVKLTLLKFETGLIRAGVLRRCTKSVEQPAR